MEFCGDKIMSNTMDFSYAARLLMVALLVVCATFQDLTSQRIPNRLLAVFLILGSLAWCVAQGLSGLMLCFVSALLVAILLFPLFMLRALSGGDVKLFAVIAGLTGIELFLTIFTLSLMAGGFAGVLVWLRRQSVLARRKHSTGLDQVLQINNDHDQNVPQYHRFPFAYPILVGTLFGILVKGDLPALVERF